MKKTEEEFVKWFDQQDYKSVPVLYNPDGSAFADYQVRSIPTEVFIDSHGKIGHVQLGAISNDDAKKIIKRSYNKKMKHEASFFSSFLVACTRSGISTPCPPSLCPPASEAPEVASAPPCPPAGANGPLPPT